MNPATELLGTYFDIAEETILKEKENKEKIENDREKVIAPILAYLKERLPEEWKDLFEIYFSFEFSTETKIGVKYCLSDMLIKGMYYADGAVNEMMQFTPYESSVTGFTSREQAHKALPLLNQSWAGFFNFYIEDIATDEGIFFHISFCSPIEYIERQREFKKSLQKV